MLSIIIDKEERISLFFCYYCLRKQCRSQRCSQLKITKNNILQTSNNLLLSN